MGYIRSRFSLWRDFSSPDPKPKLYFILSFTLSIRRSKHEEASLLFSWECLQGETKKKKKKNDRWREWQKCRGDKEVDHLLLLQELFLLLLLLLLLLIVRRYTFLSPFLDFSRVANVLHLSNYFFFVF